MGDVIINNQKYKEAKIKKFKVDGKEQDILLLTPEQIFGKDRIEVSVLVETDTIPDNFKEGV